MDDDLTHCTFDIPGIAALDGPMFQLTEGDHVAALAIAFDGSRLMLPLSAVVKMFGIKSDSRDARLLRLIEQSLKFVAQLRLGDELPMEVRTGEASWQPSPVHRQIASARLQCQLLHWLGGADKDAQITSQMLVASANDPAIRARVADALRRAGEELHITGGGPAVAALIEELATEISYIEALRERLLGRVQAIARRLADINQDSAALASGRRETVTQVLALTSTALQAISIRFDQVDAQTGDILSALSNLEQHRAFLRPNRDWLYSTLRTWESPLQEFESLPAGMPSERTWKVLESLYRFLAPIYMHVQEWQQQSAALDKPRPVFVW